MTNLRTPLAFLTLALLVAPIALAGPAPSAAYRRQHEVAITDEKDTHTGNVVLRGDVNYTGFAEFSFSGMAFGSHFVDADGNEHFCTTWREENGRIEIGATIGNAREGLLSIPAADARANEGLSSFEHWNESVVANIILTETEHTFTPGATRGLQTEYPFPMAPKASWSMRAEGVFGDISECSVQSPEGEHWSRVVFHATPADGNFGPPTFTGTGTATKVIVETGSREDRVTKHPLVDPPQGP